MTGLPPPNVRRREMERLLLHHGVSKVVVANMVEDILDERPEGWTRKALGKRLQVTFAEVKKLWIRTMACVDRTDAEVKAYYRERKRERDRRRVSNMRVQMKVSGTNGVSARARKLAAMLNDDWTPGAVLVEATKKKWRLKHDAARKAVRRAVIELSDAQIGFEQKIEIGPRGGYQTFMRLQTRRNATNIGTSELQSARSADGTRAAQSGDSNCPTASYHGGTKTCRFTEEVQESRAQVDKGTLH
jgi:hypothetical protein